MTTAQPLRGVDALGAFAADIKLSHSIFAMPFALLAATLAAKEAQFGETWGIGTFVLVVVCMIAARTVAMGTNRLLDAEIDAKNPRTSRRSIPAGRLTKRYVATTVVGWAIAFEVACVGFGLIYGNWLPALLGPLVLAVLAAYPLLKRFTSLCHYYLGLCLALAPPCAWIAVAGTIAIEPVLMGLAVLCWTAGFDVIYATADVETDVRDGVHSVPSKLGIAKALWVSRATHVAAMAFLVVLGVASPLLGAVWYAAVAIVGGLFVVEHRLVRADDLSKVGLAFFTVNGVIAVLLGSAGIINAVLA
ncbi:MAG: UbiA-like polyprenyltransferase [Planctomycetota bacterium]